MKTTLTFAFSTFLGLFLSFGQTGKLTGHLIVQDKADVKNIIGTLVMLRVDNYQRIAVVDKNLTFAFDSLKSDTTDVDLKASFYFKDTIIKKVIIKNNETVHLEIPYPPFCIYDKSKNNKICPICNRQDSVIPIVYGLIVNSSKKNKKKQQEFKAGGCTISGCDPHWYCKRDNKEF